MQGRIIKALAGFYYVEHDGVVYQTRARGNFRKKGQTPYVGDFVEFSAEENSEGYILKIGQRINSLVRPPIVNIDQAVVIMSAKEPDFNSNLLDRFLVLLEHKNIKPVIYISKMDLVEDDSEMKAIQKQYQKIGFDFIFSLEELLPLLTDKITPAGCRPMRTAKWSDGRSTSCVTVPTASTASWNSSSPAWPNGCATKAKCDS